MSTLVNLRHFSRSKSFLKRWQTVRSATVSTLMTENWGSPLSRDVYGTPSADSALPRLESLPDASRAQLVERLRTSFPQLRDVRQVVGVEIESEGIRDVYPSTLWEVKRDGSLRGEFPLECVTRPLSGDALLYALAEYCANAQLYSNAFSWRCSTHIHLNLLHLSPQEVASLCLISYAADNYFYAAGAEARRENYNCRPLSLLLPMAELLGTLARHMNRGHATKACHTLSAPQGGNSNAGYLARYSGMNWYAINTFGTLEVRHFPGSADLDQLVEWVNLCMRLTQAATRYTFEDVITLIEGGPGDFGPAVFGEDWARLRYDRHAEDWAELCEGAEHFLACYHTNTESTTSFDGLLRQNMVI